MDYLNRLEQDNVPETWHDYKPSHFKRPDYLLAAAEAVDQAWRYYDAIVEDEIFASEYWHRQPCYGLVTAAMRVAEHAAAHYSKMWERWCAEVAG